MQIASIASFLLSGALLVMTDLFVASADSSESTVDLLSGILLLTVLAAIAINIYAATKLKLDKKILPLVLTVLLLLILSYAYFSAMFNL